MDDLGRSVGDSISNAFTNVGHAIAGAVDGLIRSLGSIPGGPLWLVVIAAVLVVGAWLVARR